MSQHSLALELRACPLAQFFA